MACGVIWDWIWGPRRSGGQPHQAPGRAASGGVVVEMGSGEAPSPTHMDRDVDVIVVSGVHINGMETGTRAVDDLQPLPFLHRQLHQQRPVRQVGEGLQDTDRGGGGRE